MAARRALGGSSASPRAGVLTCVGCGVTWRDVSHLVTTHLTQVTTLARRCGKGRGGEVQVGTTWCGLLNATRTRRDTHVKLAHTGVLQVSGLR